MTQDTLETLGAAPKATAEETRLAAWQATEVAIALAARLWLSREARLLAELQDVVELRETGEEF